MSSEKPAIGFHSLSRRELLAERRRAVSAAALCAPKVFAAQLPDRLGQHHRAGGDRHRVTVGMLHSATGTMAISETGSIEAEQLAIDQINAQGGVLGPQDQGHPGRRRQRLADLRRKGEEAAGQRQCRRRVFGCWTSASRKAVLPVFEKDNGMLYYPTFYEGLEQSKNVIYTGQEATQQILAGLDWIAKEKKAKTLLPDRLGLHLAAHVEQDRAQAHREASRSGKVVGEEYYPLGNTSSAR